MQKHIPKYEYSFNAKLQTSFEPKTTVGFSVDSLKKIERIQIKDLGRSKYKLHIILFNEILNVTTPLYLREYLKYLFCHIKYW